ncbi:MAG: dimethylargininase [Lewinellaceae bacterium]|nr:hypothetical protein [Saprospiraceae bacterium]MCB9341892.1 dimethylargininase [Lewinellaceae bacterium]
MPTALLRPVSPRMAECELTHFERQPIDVALAEKQHQDYEDALRYLGCEIVHAPALPDFPDSVFVEDCAVVLDEIAIITLPGADSRKGEIDSVATVLEKYRPLHRIEAPGVLDGGDVLRLGKKIFVGLSSRSNAEAVRQMQNVLKPFDYEVIGVHLTGCLHLKSAVTQVSIDTLLLNSEWVDANLFSNYKIIETHSDEPGAANALLLGDTVIFPLDFPQTALRLLEAGMDIYLVDNSEVIKAEGGVTCCSVVF